MLFRKLGEQSNSPDRGDQPQVSPLGVVFDGIVTFGLGILLWADWPWSGVWFLGLSVGISLVLRGWSYVMFAIAIRNVPVLGDVRRAA